MRIGKNEYEGLLITPEYGQCVEFNSEPLVPFKNRTGKIIDIGANIGVMSIILSQEFNYTEIICFEPVQNICEIADGNLNTCGINHTVHNLALSNINGRIGFNASSNSQCSKINLEENENTIETRTLDSYNFKDVAIIKIDVEGHEVQVLEGSVDTINRNRPIILLEYHKEANSSEMFGLIKQLDYTWVSLETDGLFHEGRVNQLLLVPNELENNHEEV
jgi:FkbM family methyltransferase